MKKIKYVSNIAAAMLLATTIYAQTPSAQTQPKDPTPLNDPTVSDRLDKDFDSRNANMSNAVVNWYSTDYGYYGTYSNNGQDYMTRYDKNGNYVETLNKKDWSSVSPSLKSSFDKSPYKDQTVSSYWEVDDPSRKGYYLELSDKNGKTERVWADDKGQFSRKPYSVAANSKVRSK
ncbi:MAG TPA: hypothetical protein VIM65_18740 [Cyclobacteriaceae bacterium]